MRMSWSRKKSMLGAGETLENVADSIKQATSDLRGEAHAQAEGWLLHHHP